MCASGGIFRLLLAAVLCAAVRQSLAGGPTSGAGQPDPSVFPICKQVRCTMLYPGKDIEFIAKPLQWYYFTFDVDPSNGKDPKARELYHFPRPKIVFEAQQCDRRSVHESGEHEWGFIVSRWTGQRPRIGAPAQSELVWDSSDWNPAARSAVGGRKRRVAKRGPNGGYSISTDLLHKHYMVTLFAGTGGLVRVSAVLIPQDQKPLLPGRDGEIVTLRSAWRRQYEVFFVPVAPVGAVADARPIEYALAAVNRTVDTDVIVNPNCACAFEKYGTIFSFKRFVDTENRSPLALFQQPLDTLLRFRNVYKVNDIVTVHEGTYVNILARDSNSSARGVYFATNAREDSRGGVSRVVFLMLHTIGLGRSMHHLVVALVVLFLAIVLSLARRVGRGRLVTKRKSATKSETKGESASKGEDETPQAGGGGNHSAASSSADHSEARKRRNRGKKKA